VHKPVLVIACGALAREITGIQRSHGWRHLRLKCLDAKLHNTPGEIPERVRELICESRAHYEAIFVAYADCGAARWTGYSRKRASNACPGRIATSYSRAGAVSRC
jgi:hypothetical protein